MELDIYGLAVASIMSSAFLDTFDITNPSAQHSSGNESGGPISIKAATSSFSPDTGCIRAFNLLKALVTKWIQDVSLSSDPYADVILIGLYRYLCGHGNALLHDPALHRLIYGLMIKLFKRLVHELKKLGSKLVYASFNKIIIDTNKYDYRAAKEYIDFIISATISKELFSYLQIRTKEFHEQLLWLDPDNWGGIVLIDRALPDEISGDSEVNIIESEYGTKDKPSSGKDKKNHARNNQNDNDDDDDSFVEDEDQFSEEDDYDDDNLPILTKKSQYDFLDDINDEITSSKKKRDISTSPDDLPQFEDENQEQEGQEEEEYDDEVPPENNDKPIGSGNTYGLKSNWNLALFLPHPAAEYFNYIVGEYMLNYKESWETQRKLRDLQVNNMELDYADEMNNTSTPLTDEQLLENVKKEMKNKLQNDYLDKLIEIVQEIHIHFTNLPKEAGDPFPKLAGSYLNLKSPELEFIKSICHILLLDSNYNTEINGIRRVLLTQVKIREFSSESDFKDPCLSYILRDVICSYCNACKDLDLLRDASITESEEKRWQCFQCRSSLNKIEIENRLIKEAERLSLSFMLQDFRCPKTKRVSTHLCSSKSNTSSDLSMDFPIDSFMNKFTVFMKIAKFHKFELLRSLLIDILGYDEEEK